MSIPASSDPRGPAGRPGPALPAEHAGDVLAFAEGRLAAGKRVALSAVSETLGGAVRAPGALMAVDEDGKVCGYLSGGCIDADLALRARAALASGQAETVRYGVGSPFRDIALPCGGAITVVIDGAPDPRAISAARAALTARQPAGMRLGDGRLVPFAGTGARLPAADLLARYRPKLRLRIAGRGADPIALASLARAAGHGVCFWTPDPDCAADARAAGLDAPVRLTSVHGLPSAGDDDPWTAFVLMFHDPHWEDALLCQALAGPAFYIGAVGSVRTHAARCERLRAAGLAETAIARVRGPVGLLPSMRNATGLAVSALAEIVAGYEALGGGPEHAAADAPGLATNGAAA